MMGPFEIVVFTAVSVPFFGLILLIMLAVELKKARDLNHLKRYREKEEGASDLLNYSTVVEDGVVVGKNGSFMAAWEYRGEDNASCTVEEREAVTAQINAALAAKGGGWMVHVDAVRVPTPSYSPADYSHFPDVISKAIDEERRRLFDEIGLLYEGRYVLTLTWFPPLLAEQKFQELMFDDDREAPDNATRTRELLETFRRECDIFQMRLSTVLNMKRLGSRTVEEEDGRKTTYDDFLSWLHFCVTGVRQPIALPPCPMFIDSLVGGQEMWSGVVPRVGNKFVAVVAIEGFPTESYPGILSDLAELPLEYRWSTRFIFLDQIEAVNHLDKYRKKWGQKVRGFFDQMFNVQSSKIDQDAVLMVADADAAITEVKTGVVTAGYYTSVVVLMSQDRGHLEDAARKVQKEVNARGFAARVETINTFDAYLGSLPGHGVENVRRPLLHTGNLADLIPTSAIWSGEEMAPCPHYPPFSPALLHGVTDGFTPFRLNLHVRDLGHGIILGQTRAGKSTLLALIMAQFRRYLGSRVLAFDKGMSLYPVCAAVGGQHYTIGADAGELAFCPLQHLETMGDVAWAAEWIDLVLQLNGLQSSPEMRNEIASALEKMRETKQRTLTEFTMTVQNRRIREAMKPYTAGGHMGALLDAKNDGLNIDMDFVVFEIEPLMTLPDKYVVPVLLYLFRRIEKSLDGRPTLVPVEEAWLPLGHPVFAPKIREWLKSFAKKNVSLLLSTQALTDAAKSGIFDVIVESTATKIFLPNVYARNEDTASIYIRMGLNRRQIDMIAGAVAKRQYYYVSEKGRRMFELALGPVALAFVGATDLESIATIRGLVKKHGRHWPSVWLSMRGVHGHFSG